MAKTIKKKVDSGGDFDDLSDLGLDEDMSFSDEGLDSSDRNPSITTVSKDLAKEASKGFFDSLVRSTVKKSLPDEYTTSYSDVKDYVDFAKETFDRNQSKVNKSVNRAAREVKKLLPFKFKALDSYLEKYENDNAVYKQQTEEEVRDAGISSNLSSIFDKQLNIQKALTARSDATADAHHKEDISINKLKLDTLTNIDNNVSNQTAFTLQISKEYYKKSLELQFKSYFIQTDQLKTMRDYYKGFSIQLDEITKNTALPDFVKLKNTEKLRDTMRADLVDSVYKSMFSNSEYIAGIKKKIGTLVDDKINSVTQSLDQFTDSISMVNSMFGKGGGLNAILGMISGTLGNTIGDKIANKISPKLKEKIKNNKVINSGANYLASLSSSPSTLFEYLKNITSNKAEEYSVKDTVSGKIGSKLFTGLNTILGVTSPDKLNTDIQTSSILDHNKPAIFDNKVHRSITEVIPMYLAKILKENRDLNKIQQSIYNTYNVSKTNKIQPSEELIYDYENRELVSADKLKLNVEKSIFKSKNIQDKTKAVSSNIIKTGIANVSKKEGNSTNKKSDLKILKDKNTENILNDYLADASKVSGINYDYKTLIESHDKADGKLKHILDKSPELVKILEVIKRNKINENNTNIENKISDTVLTYPITSIITLFKMTSKIINSKIFNTIDNKQATIISKAFHRYILNTGSDISMKSIVNGKCFLNTIPKDEFKEVTESIQLFISEVKQIYVNNDSLQQSSLLILLSAVNQSVRNNFDIDTKTFQTLFNYSPLLVGRNKLGIENVVEGKLSNSSNIEYADQENVVTLIRPDKQTLKNAASNIVSTIIPSKLENLINSAGKDINKFKEELKGAGTNPSAIFSVLTTTLSSVKTNVENIAKTGYSKTISKIDDLNISISNMATKGAKSTLNDVSNKLSSILLDIDKRIEDESHSRDIIINNIVATYQTASETLNNISIINKSENEIAKIKKLYDIKIKMLVAFKRNLLAVKVKVDVNKDSTEVNIKDTVNMLKVNVKEVIDQTKAILEKYSADVVEI